MTDCLCVSVKFLDPLFHGKGDEEPEWPPSPMRVFQALLAGANTGCRRQEWSSKMEGAFRWLQSCGPPLIITPRAKRATAPCTFFVPNNDGDEVPDRQERLTSKVAWPHRTLDGDTVHYVWPVDYEKRSHAEVMCRLARHVLVLGWGIDQVIGNGRILPPNEVDALTGQRWRPWRIHRASTQGWRSPVVGTLEDLRAVYDSYCRRVNGAQFEPGAKPTCFEYVYYFAGLTLPPRPFAAFELPDGIAFRVEKAAMVAARLRSLACDRAKADTHEFPGGSEAYVAGHLYKRGGTQCRFSYLPLPTIGHEHTDGMIRRALIAEPYGGTGAHARWVQDQLRNAALRDAEGNERGLLLDPWRSTSKRMIERYTREQRTWSSVLPVILPGFDDGKYGKAERLFFKAATQAGMPVEAIDSLILRKAPFWRGSQHPAQYFAPEYLRHFSRWHVLIRFREVVPGPLALGPGRHLGLGLFAGAEVFT